LGSGLALPVTEFYAVGTGFRAFNRSWPTFMVTAAITVLPDPHVFELKPMKRFCTFSLPSFFGCWHRIIWNDEPG